MLLPWLRSDAEEILDREGLSARGMEILADLDRWNRRARWYAAHVRRIRAWWDALGRPRPFRVLDVGTGPGGLLAHLLDSDLPVEAVGVDLNPAYADFARVRLDGRATVEVADATALAWGDRSFDLVTNTLMMHHLPTVVRARMVAEMGRVARGVYLFDLEVTLYGVAGFAVLGPLAGLGGDAVHDGIVSIRRGSTFAEFRDLVAPLPVRAARVFPSAMCTMPR